MTRCFIDMDGVIANTGQAVIDRYFVDSGIQLKESDITHYNYFKKTKYSKFFTQEGFFRDIKPYDGAIKFVKQLDEIFNGKVYILTAIPYSSLKYCYTEKLQWIKKYLGFESDRLIICNKKEDILTKDDYFLDDRPKTLLACWEKSFNNCYLMKRPWTQSFLDTIIYEDFLKIVYEGMNREVLL